MFYGLLAGAALGYWVGGWVDAFIDAWAGMVVAKAAVKQQAKHVPEQQNRSDQGYSAFYAFNAMLAKMAKADSRVCHAEPEAVRKIYRNLQLNDQDTRTAMQIFSEVKDNAYSIYDYAWQYAQSTPENLREMAYTALLRVACADGVLHKNQDDILQNIIHHLRVSPALYENFFMQFDEPEQHKKEESQQQDAPQPDALQVYYDLLECPPSIGANISKNNTVKEWRNFILIKFRPKGCLRLLSNWLTNMRQKSTMPMMSCRRPAKQNDVC